MIKEANRLPALTDGSGFCEYNDRSPMQPMTKQELRLADRASRLGTESAFEVLVKARALEQKGKDVVHLEIGEPDFETPANIVEAGVARAARWLDALRASVGCPSLRQAIADDVASREESSRATRWSSPQAASQFFSLLCWLWLEAGDEVIYPNPAFQFMSR